MRWYVLVLLSCSLIAVSAGCKKDEATQRAPSAKQELNQAEFDVCALITKQEIEAIQRSPIKETKSSVRSDAGFRVSQCFYTAEDFSKSVSLAVTQRDPTSSGERSVKDFWNETFGRFTDEEKESNAGKEERERLREQPRREGEEKAFIPPKKNRWDRRRCLLEPKPSWRRNLCLKKGCFYTYQHRRTRQRRGQARQIEGPGPNGHRSSVESAAGKDLPRHIPVSSRAPQLLARSVCENLCKSDGLSALPSTRAANSRILAITQVNSSRFDKQRKAQKSLKPQF